MNIIKGKDVVVKIEKEIDKLKKEIKKTQPKVAIVRVGDHGDDITYERSIIKKFSQLEILTQSEVLEQNIEQEVFFNKIKKLNDDDQIHGIIILRPLPDQIDDDLLAQIIDSNKDIDGMSHTNIARVFSQDNNKGFVPCTPQAVMEIIDYLNVDLKGKNVTIVGAGMAVGRPLSILMLNQRATITVCRTLTKDLVTECCKADILVVAAGQKHLITKKHVKKDAIVIDVGINVDEDNKVVGDVDFDNVLPLAKYITPVPGGVGSITTYILAKQLYKAILIQKNDNVK